MRTWTLAEDSQMILCDGVRVVEVGDYSEVWKDAIPFLQFIVDAANEKEQRDEDFHIDSARWHLMKEVLDKPAGGE